MKNKLFRQTLLIVLALACPIAAWGLSGTVTLAANNGVSFDTGATSSSNATGDIYWNGSNITFIGKAKGAVLPGITGSSFNLVTQTLLAQVYSLSFSTAAISSGSLPAGTVFGVLTNGGNYAAVMVTSISAGSITLQYVSFVTVAPTGPQITNVANNYSYIPAGFVNSGISPSSIFTIFGTNLAAPSSGTAAGLQSSAAGIPTTWNGATVTVSVGGKNFTPGLYYALPTQIAAVLPAATPTGSGTVTVNYNGTSNAYAIQVVANALGLDTYYGTGAGLVTATDATTGALITYTNSARPLEVLVFWGSGNGADPLDSDTVFTSTPHSVNQSATVFYIGGVAATVQYAGSSGYPGLNQINVQVPASVTGGCANSVVGVTNGQSSNFGFLPVSQTGGVCNDAYSGIGGTLINTLGTQSTVNSGTLFLGQLTSPSTGLINFASAMFQSTTGVGYGSSNGIVSVGSCSVTETVSTTAVTTFTGLDAGTISVTGPAGNYPLTETKTGMYSAQLPASAITSAGGAFTYNIGGGTNVGKTTDTINLPNPILNWTNQAAAATVTLSQGMLATWSGGQPGSVVVIMGSSSGANGTNGNYTCYAPQSALQFMVPSYVTGTLPPGTGTTTVENVTDYSMFSATGLDFGIGFGFTSVQVNSTFK
jgi:uncharacterized protein (TIGR03437 family)